MTKTFSNSAHKFFTLTLVIFTLLIFCSNIFGQIGLSTNNLAINALAANNKENSSLERPRIVSATVNKVDGELTDLDKFKADTENAAAMLAKMERQAFDILNQKRIDNGLHPLKWSEEMAKIARLHSQDMAQYKYFSHSGRNGTMVSDRADSLGISNWLAIGENIAFNRGFAKPAEFACEGWMKSPSHKDNILNVRWKEAGIGAAVASDGSYYFTEVFILK